MVSRVLDVIFGGISVRMRHIVEWNVFDCFSSLHLHVFDWIVLVVS